MTPPPPSATRLVQSLLSTHPHLSTTQMFTMATDHLRPVIRPAHVLNTDGKIRMKRVSNMREGRRPWVPMPPAPFPEHPFKSVSFLKRTVLTSLESQGLIHKARIEMPITTEEQRQEAIANAMRLTRKDERTALRLNQPVPPPRVPKETYRIYRWKMGPAPPRLDEEYGQDQEGIREEIEEEEVDYEQKEEERERELARRMRDAWAAQRGEALPMPPGTATASSSALISASASAGDAPSSTSTATAAAQGGMDPETAARWDQADRLEAQFTRARQIEAEQIVRRQEARRAAYKLERAQRKAERKEDEVLGRAEAVKEEKKRIEALEAIENYAKQTGEDVSHWYEELGQRVGEELPVSEETARRRKRGGGFGLR